MRSNPVNWSLLPSVGRLVLLFSVFFLYPHLRYKDLLALCLYLRKDQLRKALYKQGVEQQSSVNLISLCNYKTGFMFSLISSVARSWYCVYQVFWADNVCATALSTWFTPHLCINVELLWIRSAFCGWGMTFSKSIAFFPLTCGALLTHIVPLMFPICLLYRPLH